ncbi:MAG TPA: tRNA (adenosine(37)-N6)-threonylcarbamoyltransferase complex dimerization subunit type 1 TsaB [Bacteroidales bacterium]|nr:tRNA (adenosine(37)-N6)-threonylcarbamoyltransferase complex dimerization subunit type 1 TsaB [Bacteroidales bacterium]
MILCIETATSLCSVALCDGSTVVSLRESNDSKSHASMLTVFIDELLKEARIKPAELEAVAVSKGPGSYTGLRIGISAAKGISFGASVPLIGIETITSMFHGFIRSEIEYNASRLYCPMLDARRMEVYYAVYDSTGYQVKEISADIMNENSFSSFPEEKEIVLFGEGAKKLKDVIKKDNIIFNDDFRISASHLCFPAHKAFNAGKFENVAYFEPLYLKDFIITKQKKNIL